MPKYVKKPIPIEAYQLPHEYDKEGVDKFHEWATEVEFDAWYIDKERGGIVIKTLEGLMFCKAGDYVIKGIRGEFYSCDREIFEESYDRVEEGMGWK